MLVLLRIMTSGVKSRAMCGRAAPASRSPLATSEVPEAWRSPLRGGAWALRENASMSPGVTTIELTSSTRSFHVPRLSFQYEIMAMNLRAYSGVSVWPGSPAWDAELEGVRLHSDETDSAVAAKGFLMLMAGTVSGTSSSSSSSSEDSDSEVDCSDEDDSSDETSEGWYSCLSGDEVRRLIRAAAAGSSAEGFTANGLLGPRVR